MNQTQTVDRNDWAAFAAEFTKMHEGKTARLEALDSDSGDQYAAENLPFQGMSLESKGSEAGSLILMLGTEEADHIERIIQAPPCLRAHEPPTEPGLQIEAGGGEPTLLLHLTPLLAITG